MKHWKRIAALCLAACMCLSMFACTGSGNDPTGQEPGNTETQPKAVTHTVQLSTEGGMPLEGVGVYVYMLEDGVPGELVWFGRTDAQGKMTFDAPEADGYVAVLENAPVGYSVENMYPITGLETSVALAAAMASDVDLSTLKLGLGDAMFDLEVTDINGNTWKISELLKQKKAVMLNFWYLSCTPCRSEFPYLQEAYASFEEDVAVLALNPVDTDADKIKEFAEELKLTMPVAACDPALEKVMGLMAYPTSIIIDRYGMISLIHQGAITNKEGFQDIFAYFTADDYQQAPVENLEDILVTEPSEEIKNPTEVGGVTSFELTVKPGEVVYCDLYRLNGMYLQLRSDVAYLIYNGKTYEPRNGVIGVTVFMKDTRTPATIGVGNSGAETETFTISFVAPGGSLNNPYNMTLGEFEVSSYAGNDQGVYYRYVAEADGYLVMQCLSSTEGVPYDYTLYNLSSYANRNLASDAELDADGNVIVKVQVKKGQFVQFSASALPDDSGFYPAINMHFKAELQEGLEDDEDKKEKIAYAVTVTDEQMKPVEKVPVIITGVDAEGKTTTENLHTDTRGMAAVMLPKGTYTATIGVPAGYTAKTVKLTLTEVYPTQSVKLDTVEDTTTDYTVTVTDETGAAIANVLVTVGDSFAYTDENGLAAFRLPEGAYTAIISIPEGYTGEISHPFPADQNDLTVVLTKGTEGGEPSGETICYSITVVDYYSSPISGVTVTFRKDGVPAGIAMTDASGVAQAQLEKGDYTAALSFSAGSYNYTEAQLSESETSATITAVRNCGNDYRTLYVGTAYNVELGATYVSGMQADAYNYFVFAPKVSGVYRFTTNSPDAVISYWGASDAYITDQTTITDYADNAFTREVYEEQTETTIFIIAVNGASECILEITRIGDIQLTDEEKAEWIIFEGTMTPAEGTVYNPTETGTLTYVDIAGNTSDYTLVLGSDGFYHIGAADGPLMYVNLGPKGRYITFYEMMGFQQAGGTNMHQVFYDENGKFIQKVDYTTCLKAYTGCVNVNGDGVYPLTEDLMTILINGGENKGWWDSTNPNFLFSGVSGLNTEIAWMFNCCYYK